MAEEPENAVLLLLREIRAGQERSEARLDDVGNDISILREEIAATRQVLLDAIVQVSVRLSRIEDRVGRLEKV